MDHLNGNRSAPSRLANAYRCHQCGGDHFGKPCNSVPLRPELGAIHANGGHPEHVPALTEERPEP